MTKNLIFVRYCYHMMETRNYCKTTDLAKKELKDVPQDMKQPISDRFIKKRNSNHWILFVGLAFVTFGALYFSTLEILCGRICACVLYNITSYAVHSNKMMDHFRPKHSTQTVVPRVVLNVWSQLVNFEIRCMILVFMCLKRIWNAKRCLKICTT